jgi:hypothetical protein
MRTLRFAHCAVVLAFLVGGCVPAVGNATLGPDPGGGFYCPHNAFEGVRKSLNGIQRTWQCQWGRLPSADLGSAARGPQSMKASGRRLRPMNLANLRPLQSEAALRVHPSGVGDGYKIVAPRAARSTR